MLFNNVFGLIVGSGFSTLLNDSEFPALDSGTLRCYSMRFCPFAHRTRLVLAHKGIPCEIINIPLKPQCPDWFLERNRFGQVPVLEKDGKVLHGSTICCDYLDDTYPENRLTPSDPYRKARDNMLLKRFSDVPALFNSILHSKRTDENVLEKIKKSFEPFEETLRERGNYFGGDSVCMLDYMIWPWIEQVPLVMIMSQTDILPCDQFPHMNNWSRDMINLPVVQECYISSESRFKFYFSGPDNPDNDVGLDQRLAGAHISDDV